MSALSREYDQAQALSVNNFIVDDGDDVSDGETIQRLQTDFSEHCEI